MRKSIIFLFLLFIGFAAVAQDVAIEKIRELYKSTQELIDSAQSASDEPHGGLYCNEVVVNKHAAQWRAVGDFKKVIRFWYLDQPEFAEMENGSKESALRKVEISSKWSADNTENYELLFNNGELVFCFKKEASYDNKEKPIETRWYFDNGKLIRYMEGQEIIKEMPDAKEIHELSKSMMNLFFNTFN